MTEPLDAAPPPDAIAPEPPADVPPPGPRVVGVRALHDLSPDAPLTDAYKAGAIGFHEDERVPVRLADGAIGTVAARDLPGVVDAGGALVHPTVLHQAKIEADYGGAGGAVGAGVAGAARGASVGLSDPAALALVGAVRGGEAKERLRERLAAYKELHPIASTAGELAGVAAPAFVSGGAAAAPEGAGLLARGGELAARGVRGAGALGEGVGALGRLAEHGTARALARLGEREGAGLARRMTEAALTKAAGAGVEGALYGAGSEISEASLDPDHELTAEKLRAAIGHGALMGAALGGVLGAGVEAGKAALVKASPFLRSAARENAVRALDARGRFTREMDKLPGGREALGDDLLDSTIATPEGTRAKVLVAGDTIHTIAPKLDALAEERFARIESHIDQVSDATNLTLDDVVGRLEARKREFGGLGEEAAAAAIERQIENVKRVFSPGGKAAMEEIDRLRPPKLPKEPPGVNPELAGKGTVHRFDFNPNAGAESAAEESTSAPIVIDKTRPGHIGEGVILNPRMTEGADVAAGPIAIARDEAATAAAARAPIDANRAARLETYADQLAAYEKKLAAHDARVAAIDPKNVRISIRDLLEERRRFEKTIDWRTEGSVVTQGKRAVGRTLEDLVVDKADEAARARGVEGFAEAYKKLKLEWRRAKVASDAVTDAVARSESNASHSLTDKLFAGHGFHGAGMHALASGHLAAVAPQAIVGGMVAGAASKLVRTRGRATLAAAFDKLSTLQAIARRTETVDHDIAQGAKAFADRAKGDKPRLRFKRISRDREEAREEYARAAAELPAAAGADHGAAALPIASHAPTVAGALASRSAAAAAWLASQLPPTPKWGSPTPSDQAIHDFLVKKDAVDHPVQTIAGGLARGDLTVAETRAVEATSPKLFAYIQGVIEGELRKVLAKDHYLDYETRRDLSLLFGVESDWSMTPQGIKALQAPAPPPAKGSPGGGPSPRRAAARTPEATQLQTATERRQGGELR